MSSTRTPDPNPGWLSDDELAEIRQRLPLLYVEGVPVRLDGMGNVSEVGLLLRVSSEGSIARALVAGRVMFGETVRDALFRHLEKDLGPMAFPQIPRHRNQLISPSTFPIREPSIKTIASTPCLWSMSFRSRERVNPDRTLWSSPGSAPEQATSHEVLVEMEGGRGSLVKAALASVGACLSEHPSPRCRGR